MRRARFWFPLFLAACGSGKDESCVPTAPPPQDCARLPSETWRVYSTPSESVVRIEVGGSRQLFLDPSVEPQCLDTVASVGWSVTDASVATTLPADPPHRGCWVSGLLEGTTWVSARITFRDGRAKLAEPWQVQIVTAQRPAGIVVAEGTVDLEPGNNNPAADFQRYIPFPVPPASKTLDLRVHWGSPLNRLRFALFEGDCSGGPAASCQAGLRYIDASTTADEKPFTWSHMHPATGIHTVRIDNLGPGAETARYEVRITPG